MTKQENLLSLEGMVPLSNQKETVLSSEQGMLKSPDLEKSTSLEKRMTKQRLEHL